MKESIHQYFRVGTIQWMSFPHTAPLESLRAIARDDFFDAVEVKGYGGEQANAEAKSLLAQSGLTVCYGAQPRLLGPGLNPNALDEPGRLAAEATLREAVDEAEYLGRAASPFWPANGPRRPRSRRIGSCSKPPAAFAIMRPARACRWSWKCLITTWTRPR